MQQHPPVRVVEQRAGCGYARGVFDDFARQSALMVVKAAPPARDIGGTAMTPSTAQARLERMHQAMAARIENREMPGIVTAVADADDVWVDPVGVLAFDSDRPMRRDTIFRIASLTKPIVAAATMTLVEEGRLALDEPIDRLLPELANRRVLRRLDGPLDDTVPANRPITVEDLLTHRMGYGMIFEPSFEPPYPIINAANELQLVLAQPDPPTPHDPDEWIRRFGTLPLMYQPGERWQYNAGSLVLGVLIARAAGQSLPDLFRSRIFEPLGMAGTGFSIAAADADRLPACYMTNFQTGKLEVQPYTESILATRPPAFPSGASGLLSTVDDYLALARMLLNRGVHGGHRLLSEGSVELMTTNHLTPEQAARRTSRPARASWPTRSRPRNTTRP
jgi:CubicO group peptidase (beta-lactamase class C family)